MIFSLAQLNASDYQFVRQADNRLIYDAINTYFARVNEDVLSASAIFIEEVTEAAKERYLLPGSGRISQRGRGLQGNAVRATGSWDTAYPLRDYAEMVVGDRVDWAYMTPADLDRHVTTIRNRYMNEIRHQILHALFDNVQESFSDPRLGTLTIEPLANNDAVVYPPVLGTNAEATDNHYAISGYTSANISDTNNPYRTQVAELQEHFGRETGGRNVITYINETERTVTEDLTDFTPIPDNFIMVGDNVDVPQRLPSSPGEIIGRTNGTWVAVWDWIPTTYLLSVHLEEPAPLKMRVDPAATGLPRGLQLVASDDGDPLMSSEFGARFGIAVGNRLNGAVMELDTVSFTVPAAYT
jgi:hypothetical protein